MMSKGDTSRPRSVKSKFDQDFEASSNGGGVLLEKVMRRTGVYHFLKSILPSRSPHCEYATEELFYALISSLLLGGRGIGAVEKLRNDEICSQIFGLENGPPSPSTIYRGLCDMAGLSERPFEEVYRQREASQPRLDLGGKERKDPRTRRIVPDEPEWAQKESREAFAKFIQSMANRCAQNLSQSIMRMHGWSVVFGDGTDLEVEGECFDAARLGKDGEKMLRLMLLMLGPIVVSQDILPGNVDEGRWLPQLIERSRETIKGVIGPKGKVLSLLDAAFFEKAVVDALEGNNWDFIICANQQRDKLESLAMTQPDYVWMESGADVARGWSRSQIAVFTHTPEDWSSPVTIVCRRWQNEDEIDGIWHYSFVATRLEPGDMPKKLMKKYSYGQAIWMLYSTKQGRENHLKTILRDLGLHNPPSGRLGVNQAFYSLALAASNIAMVLRYRVMPKDVRGMHLWKMRTFFFNISGYIRYHARTLCVYLAGGNIPVWMQNVWDRAFAEAGRL